MNVSTPISQGQDPAAPWHAQAESLCAWTWDHLVNRTDRYGRYYSCDGVTKSITAWTLTLGAVLQHFTATCTDHVIGLSSASDAETCRWAAWDMDVHGKPGDDPVRNFDIARAVYHALLDLGLAARLTDSNGNGGYHVRVLFATPQPMALTYRLGRYLLRDYASYGCASPPESFPKSPALTGKRCGTWLRCPGRHHKREHWTQVWNDKTGAWKSGDRAIDSILEWRGVDPDWDATLPADFQGMIKARKPRVARDRMPAVPIVRTARPDRVVSHSRDAAKAARALAVLGAEYYDDYNRWVWVGMCLAQLGDDGLALWHTWSSQSFLYDPDAVEAKWPTYAPGGTGASPNTVGLGSLFHEARALGWRDTTVVTLASAGALIETRRNGRGGNITFTL